MERNIAIRIRLYPTKEQRQLFTRTAGCCRFLYNLGLEQRERFSRRDRHIGYVAQAGELKDLKAEEAEWLKGAPHHCLQQALRDLEDAFKRFFSGQNGYPKPRKRGINDSFRFPDPQQLKLDASGCDHKGRGFRIFLPKAGWVAGVLHRPIAADAKLKSVTVSRDGAWWMASLLFAVPVEDTAERTIEELMVEGAVGIDLGVSHPVVTSHGEVISLPRVTDRLRLRERRLRQAIARRKKGARNRRKAVRALSRLTARVARRRKDALHKVTTAIAKSHGIVVIEDLKVRNMTASAKGTVEEPGTNVRQKAGLNRSLLDVAPGMFRTLLEYKLRWRGGRLIAVDPRNTSRTCPVCGHCSPNNRPSRDEFRCERCGHQADADANAAGNILARGLEMLATNQTARGRRVAACGDLRVSVSTKQEACPRGHEMLEAA